VVSVIQRLTFLRGIRFGEPDYLWLLIVPAVLLLVWLWRFWNRRGDTRRLARRRTVPFRERFAMAGDLPFWLCVIAATACLVLAIARPRGPSSTLRRGGIDLVILQDGSASMRVRDVAGDRWQRSVDFLKVLGDALSWTNDRIAMTLFAHVAVPQIRLTNDPNTFFFFLDHLYKGPPFRLEDDTTWDTNLELGVHWGLRLIDKDEEIRGRSPNAKLFVMLSDGEAWSGEVETSLKRAVDRGIPLFVVGVGTLAGGLLPVVPVEEGELAPLPPLDPVSRLDRRSLQLIATEAGGQYFELDRDNDRDIANAIVDAGRRLAPPLGVDEQLEDLYWRFLVAAAVFGGVGLLFLRERAELWMQLAGAVLTILTVSGIL
jgi:hypothetical protein